MNRVFIGIILIAVTLSEEDRISDYRLCADPKCSVPIARGKTLLYYVSDDSRLLSFKSGASVEIYSKSAGSKPDLWGVKIYGKRGYVPKNLIREDVVLKKHLNFMVPTEYNTAAKSTEDKESAANSINGKENIAKSVDHEGIAEKSNDDKNAIDSTDEEESTAKTAKDEEKTSMPLDKEIASNSVADKEITGKPTNEDAVTSISTKKVEITTKSGEHKETAGRSNDDKESAAKSSDHEENTARSTDGNDITATPFDEEKEMTTKSLNETENAGKSAFDKYISGKSVEENEITVKATSEDEETSILTEKIGITAKSGEDKEIAANSSDDNESAVKLYDSKEIASKSLDKGYAAKPTDEDNAAKLVDKEMTSRSVENEENSTKSAEEEVKAKPTDDEKITSRSEEDKEYVTKSADDGVTAKSNEEKEIAAKSGEHEETAARSNDEESSAKSSDYEENMARSTDGNDNTATPFKEGKEMIAKSLNETENIGKSVIKKDVLDKSFENNEILLQSTHDTRNEPGKETGSNGSDTNANQSVTSPLMPSLASHGPSASPNFRLFSFKGVSAEPSENKPPSPDAVVKPYDVFEGTTVYYSTAGETEVSSDSSVRATAVPRDTTPSATMVIPPPASEGSSDVKPATHDSKIGEGTETEEGGKPANKTSSVDESEDVYVDDDDDDDDNGDDGDDDYNTYDDGEESNEDHAESKDEKEKDADDATKTTDGYTSKPYSSEENISSEIEESSLNNADSKTESEDILPTPSPATENYTLKSSESSPSSGSFEPGLNDSSSNEPGSHDVTQETVKSDISKDDILPSSEEMLPRSTFINESVNEQTLSDKNITQTEHISTAYPAVVEVTEPDTITEIPINEAEASPPASFEAPTENPLVSGEDLSTEGSSSDEELSQDVEGSLYDVEKTPAVEKPSDIVEERTSLQNEETKQKVASSDSVDKEGTTTTKVHTEHEDDHDSGSVTETGQESSLGAEPSQEDIKVPNSRLSDSVVKRETPETQPVVVSQQESSAGLLSSIAGTFRRGYESVEGMFWSALSEETATTESVGTTTSTPEESVPSDGEMVEKDVDPLSINESTQDISNDLEETSGTKSSLLSATLEESPTKQAPPENAPETVPNIETCRVDPGVDSTCAEAGGSPSVMDPYSSVRKLQQDVGDAYREEAEDDYLPDSSNTIWFVMSTGVLVTVFTLGFIYLEKNKFNRALVAEVNALKKALQIKSIENISKRDEGVLEQRNNEELHATISSLEQQLQDSLERCAELDEKVVGLEKELETATETGLELNKMLGDMLASQQDSDQLVHNMEDLRRQLDTQEAAMKADLATKTSENEKLQLQLDKVLERNNHLDYETKNLKQTYEQCFTQQKEFQKQNEVLQAQLSEEQKRAAKLSESLQSARQAIEELNQALAVKDSELTVLQDCLKQSRAGEGEEEGIDKFQALLDVGHVRAELKMITLEREALTDRLRGEEGSRKLLEDHVEVISREVDNLRARYEEAEKEKLEAQTRLEVLSNYFKEKETQLQKELGLQEAMNLQKDGDVVTTFERIRLLQDEVENYNGEISSSTSVNTADSPVSPKKKKKPKAKRLRQNHGSQVETLKKEILDQERGLKSQISQLEKKAHENWVAARQAERRLEESKQEAGQLRNRLTIVEKNITNTSTPNGDTSLKMTDRLPSESNGELPMSPPLIDSPLHYRDGLPVSPPLLPPFMLPPPGVPFMPPPAFMPPPPMFPGDRRPPPLGRMSSPPPRFSPPPPPSDYSPSYDERSEDHTPPHYHSPVHFDNVERYRRRTPPRWDQPVTPRSGFRPLPPNLRTTPREAKGSAVSSGHSSESLEKLSRHSDNNMV